MRLPGRVMVGLGVGLWKPTVKIIQVKMTHRIRNIKIMVGTQFINPPKRFSILSLSNVIRISQEKIAVLPIVCD